MKEKAFYSRTFNVTYFCFMNKGPYRLNSQPWAQGHLGSLVHPPLTFSSPPPSTEDSLLLHHRGQASAMCTLDS